MVSILSKMKKNDLRELLVKGWMTHDALWMYHCIQECGIEKANSINLAAVQSMALIEIKRIMKALGFPKDHKVERFDELIHIIEGTFDLIKGDFMKGYFSAPEKNRFNWEWERGKCFAFEGISNLGLIDQYQCGIMKRIEGWLKGLHVEYEMRPEINGCLMHKSGTCSGEFIVQLK